MDLNTDFEFDYRTGYGCLNYSMILFIVRYFCIFDIYSLITIFYFVNCFCRKIFIFVYRYNFGNHFVSIDLNVQFKVSVSISLSISLDLLSCQIFKVLYFHSVICVYRCHLLLDIYSSIGDSRLTIPVYTSAGIFRFIFIYNYCCKYSIYSYENKVMRMDKLFHISCVPITYLRCKCLTIVGPLYSLFFTAVIYYG